MHPFKIIAVVILSGHLLASENLQEMPSAADLFHNFDQNLLQSFSNGYGLYHLGAIGLSYGLIKNGADWQYYQYMQDHKSIAQAGFAGVIVGGLVPLSLPVYLYFRGKSDQDAKLMYTALALGQSVITSWLVTSAYKTITGRKPPADINEKGPDKDYSDDFNFGLMRRGIFDGWPSGHTTNAFAMAAVLWQLYPENQTLKLYSGAYAFFIGLSISTNIHWFSDFVAGALIGYSIGKSIGQSFKNVLDGKQEENKTSLYFIPGGLGFTFRF